MHIYSSEPRYKKFKTIKRIAELWKEVPEAEKKVYEDAYKVDWKAYKEDMNRIREVLTPAQRASSANVIMKKHLKRKVIV